MKILKMSAKCSDLFQATLEENGKEIVTYSGYVPDFMPNEHWGDYVQLDIDIDTGKILNWKKPTDKELKDQLNK